MSDVFISYSRKDTDFVRKLNSQLMQLGREVWVDWEDIARGTDWMDEIKDGIDKADTFAFVISRNSLCSQVCNQELEHALKLNKRIAPIIFQRIEGDLDKVVKGTWVDVAWGELARQNWKALGNLNWLFFEEEKLFDDAIKGLVRLMDEDPMHVKQHTRLLSRAQDWDRAARNPSFLLDGEALVAAENWLAHVGENKPAPADLHRTYIVESRRVEDQRIAAAKEQEARISELSRLEEEQKTQIDELGRRSEQLRRRTRRAYVAVSVLMLAVTITGVLIYNATQAADQARRDQEIAQRNAAVANAQVAQAATEAAGAGTQIAVAEGQLAAVGATLTPIDATLQAVNTNIPPTLTLVAQQIANSQAEIASLQLAEQAGNVVRETQNMELSTLLAIRALNTIYTPQAYTALVGGVNGLKTVQHFQQARGNILSAALSPDGQYVVTASSDLAVRLWDTETGQVIREFEGMMTTLNVVAFSPDGNYVAAGGFDPYILEWKISTGEISMEYTGFAEQVTALTYSPDATLLLASTGEDTAWLWNVYDGTLIREFSTPGWEITDVSFNSEGTQLLTVSSDNIPRVWEIAFDKESIPLTGISAAFVPGRSLVVTGQEDGTTQYWDLETGQSLGYLTKQVGSITKMGFTPDSSYFFTATDNVVQVWDTSMEILTNLYMLSGHRDSVTGLSVTQNEVLTVSADGSARLWSPSFSGEYALLMYSADYPVNSVAFSPDRASVIIASDNWVVQLFDTTTQTEIRRFAGHRGDVYAVAFSPDGRYVATGGEDNTLRLWDAATGEPLYSWTEHVDDVTSVAFSPDSKWVVSGSQDRSVRLWNTQTGEAGRRFRGHFGIVNSVGFSPDGQAIASASQDGSVRVWNAVSGGTLHEFEGRLTVDFNSVAFSPDGKTLAAGASDRVIYLWNLETGVSQTQTQLNGHRDEVLSVAFSPDGRSLLSGSSDTTVRLWDLGTGEALRQYTVYFAAVNSVSFSSDGQSLLTGSADGSTHVWSLDYQDLIDYACARVFRDLTRDERQLYNVIDDEPTCPKFVNR